MKCINFRLKKFDTLFITQLGVESQIKHIQGDIVSLNYTSTVSTVIFPIKNVNIFYHQYIIVVDDDNDETVIKKYGSCQGRPCQYFSKNVNK